MQEAIHKAAALIEAYEYIRRFNEKIVVVKIGGAMMDDAQTLQSLIQDICFLHAVGMRPILVHGGGKSITEAMQSAGIEAQFVRGHRYTDDRTLSIAEHVLINEVNQAILNQIRQTGPKAMGLHSLSSCVVFAKRLFLETMDDPTQDNTVRLSDRQATPPQAAGGIDSAGDTGGVSAKERSKRKIDVGLVGQVERVNADLINALVEARYIPVIAPISRDAAGGKLNVNADSVAGHVAAAVKAEKLVLVSDTHGIRLSQEVDHLASHLTKEQIEGLIDDGVITAGMLPKVEAGLTALKAGVSKVHIVDGRISHSLLLEIYTKKGIGTEIVL